jgi:hypothetical protein
MLTPSRVPVVTFALGLGVSLVAGVQYLSRVQGGLTSKPS